MFARYRVSWRLVHSCLRLLHSHSDLLLFPILTVILVTLLIALTAAGILFLVNFDLSVFSQLTFWQQTLLTFIYYVVSYCLGIYTNTALVTIILQLLAHQPIDMRAGWRVANQRRASILGYALIMATVGMILRLIFKPIGKLGGFVAPAITRITAFTFIGLAWNLVPYFVVPVLIAENPGSFSAIQRSSALVRQRWGEDVVVNASIWLIFALPFLVVVALGGPAITWAFIYLNEWRITWVVYAVTMSVLLTFLFKMTMDAIFAAVAYHYATTGEIHTYFYEEDLQSAFVKRPSRLVNAARHWLEYGVRLFRRKSPSPVSLDTSSKAVSFSPDDHAAVIVSQPTPMQEHRSERSEDTVQHSDGV